MTARSKVREEWNPFTTLRGNREKMTSDTPLSLLERLASRSNDADWRRMLDIYTPLLRRWLANYQLPDSDIDDVMQDVFQTLFKEIAGFRHNGNTGAFRKWLRSTIVNRLKWHWRDVRSEPRINGELVDGMLNAMVDPDSDPNVMWDREHDSHVIRNLLSLVEPQFSVTTWQAFRLQVLEGLKAQATAEKLGTTVNAALIAKSRVMKALRDEARGMIDID